MMIKTTTKQLNPYTISIVQESVNREQIRLAVVDTTDRYKAVKFMANYALQHGDRKEWSKCMQLCKGLKKLLGIQAEWLHVAIYGYSKADR